MKKLMLLFAMGVCFVLSSCMVDEEMVPKNLMMGQTLRPPYFVDCKAVAEDEFQFTFSHSVNFISAAFEPAVSIGSIENGSTVKIKLNDKLPPGILLMADILAEDENKNTINVIVPVRARNNRMPSLVINEVRTENSTPRCEFIEFVTKTGGNLGGMRVFIFGNTNAARKTIFEFSPVEVKQGEYIMLNLRTPQAECKNEYGSNLAESGGENASSDSRDFWIPGNTKLIHKTSIIYVLDQDDNVLASLMISETPDEWWGRNEHAEAAEFLYRKGTWKSSNETACPPSLAVNSTGTTTTRTICRDETKENTNTASDWYIAATSGHTPGKPNNPKRYYP